MIDNDNTLIIKDDEGNEMVMNILFTYENDENHKKYVFFYDPTKEEEIICMGYDEQGNLMELSDEEYDEAEEVLNAYNEDPKIQEIK